MPVKVRKLNHKYRVSHGGKISAKGTTKVKATAQANLLRGIAHGWKPTGAPARSNRRRLLKKDSRLSAKKRNR